MYTRGPTFFEVVASIYEGRTLTKGVTDTIARRVKKYFKGTQFEDRVNQLFAGVDITPGKPGRKATETTPGSTVKFKISKNGSIVMKLPEGATGYARVTYLHDSKAIVEFT